MKRIVLISCVSKKLPHREKVENIYISTYFKYCLKYAKQLNPDQIYILSAKHGLLALDQEIDTYDITLNNMKSAEIKEWTNKVKNQLDQVCDLENTEFTILAGDKYRKYLLPELQHYKLPLQGLGIGKQLGKLKEWTTV